MAPPPLIFRFNITGTFTGDSDSEIFLPYSKIGPIAWLITRLFGYREAIAGCRTWLLARGDEVRMLSFRIAHQRVAAVLLASFDDDKWIYVVYALCEAQGNAGDFFG